MMTPLREDVLVDVLGKRRGDRVDVYAVAVRAVDNFASRTIVDRRGRAEEESFAAPGLTLWREA